MRGRLPPMWALLALFLFLAGASTVAALPVESEWDDMTDLQMMPCCEGTGFQGVLSDQPADFPGASEIDVFSALYCVIAGD